MKKLLFIGLLSLIALSDFAQTIASQTIVPGPFLLRQLHWRYNGRQLFQPDQYDGLLKGGAEFQTTPLISTGAGDTLVIITRGDSTSYTTTRRHTFQGDVNINDTLNVRAVANFAKITVSDSIKFSGAVTNFTKVTVSDTLKVTGALSQLTKASVSDTLKVTGAVSQLTKVSVSDTLKLSGVVTGLPFYTRDNPGAAALFQPRVYAKELTVSGGGGLALDTLTVEGTAGGTALFSTVYSYQATALANDTIEYPVHFQTLGTGNKLPIVRVGGGVAGAPAPEGTKVAILIVGKP